MPCEEEEEEVSLFLLMHRESESRVIAGDLAGHQSDREIAREMIAMCTFFRRTLSS